MFERSLYLVSNTRRQIRTYMRTLIPFIAEMTSMQRSAVSVNVVYWLCKDGETHLSPTSLSIPLTGLTRCTPANC